MYIVTMSTCNIWESIIWGYLFAYVLIYFISETACFWRNWKILREKNLQNTFTARINLHRIKSWKIIQCSASKIFSKVSNCKTKCQIHLILNCHLVQSLSNTQYFYSISSLSYADWFFLESVLGNGHFYL